MRILIVENDSVSAAYLAAMLRNQGHEAIITQELHCLDEIRTSGRVDVVITDIFLDNTSGLQIVLDVKDHYPDIKVVAISGGGEGGNFDYLDYAVEFGADAVVRKPAEPHVLAELLNGFAGVSASGGQAEEAAPPP